jgi:hypoxanthine phosphoribosyltransferase
VAADLAPTLLPWNDLVTITTRLAERIRLDGRPDVLVGVLRGGLVPAVLLAHALGCRSVRAVEVIHTTRDGVDAAKTIEPHITNPASLGDLHNLDVLLVDDIAGTGDTIHTTAGLVAACGARRVRTAVCAVNAANWRRPHPPTSQLTYIGTTDRGWVIFPWEQP